MWRNFSRKFVERKAWMGIVLPIWVIASFALVQIVVGFTLNGLRSAGVSFDGINDAVLSTSVGVIVYALTLLMVIGLPWLIKKSRTSKSELGLAKLPGWLDILLAPAGFVIYILLSALFVVIAQNFLPFIDLDQVQDTGFHQLTYQYEYILAFLMLVVVAPAAEEILFRGYLLGKLLKYVPVWVAVLITSGLFAVAHGAWNVGIDVFALSIVLCLLRIYSKSLWPSILLHMIKNGLAYYLLFINPTLLSTLGG